MATKLKKNENFENLLVRNHKGYRYQIWYVALPNGSLSSSSNYSPGVKFDPTLGVTSFTWDYIGKILEISLYVAIRPRVRATKFGM